MKKFFIMAMAVAAIGFTSCGNKTQNAAPAEESTEVSAVADAAKGVVDKLKEQIEAGDSKAIGEAVQTAVEKVAELVAKGDTEAAKQYQDQIKNFIDENAEKIKEVTGGDEAVSKLIDSFVNVPVKVEDAVNAAGESIKEGAEQVVEDAKNAAAQKVEEAKEAAAQKVEDAKAAAAQKVDEAKQKAADAAAKKIEEGKQKANDAANKAAEDLMKKISR